LSESGFTGLWDFQDFIGASLIGKRTSAIVSFAVLGLGGVLSESGFAGLWDFQDFIGASLIGKRSPVFILERFLVMRKARVGRKRNPENPANPENPDSDKRAQATARVPFGDISRYGEKRELGESESEIPQIPQIP